MPLPYAPVPQVAAQGEPSPGMNVQANPAEFGGLVAAGTEKLGAGIGDVGTSAAQVALKIQALNNETAARNASNDYIKAAGQSWAQYSTLQGKAAVDGYPGFTQQLQDLQKQHSESLASPQARNDFLNASSYMLNRLTLMSSTHVAQQQEQYWKQSHAANIENMTQNGVLMQNDPNTVDAAANSIVHSVSELGQMNGWDPKRVAAEAAIAQGKYYRTVIESQAARDPAAAAATFERVRDKMDGVSIAETDRMLRPAMDNATVAGAVRSITSGNGAPVAAGGGSVADAIHAQEGSANGSVSTAGARGQWQIMPATFRQYAKPGESIDNPADNEAVGRRIVDDLSQRYPGDPARVAVGYFSGPGNVAPAGNPTPWVEDKKDTNGTSTSQYVGGVLKRLGGSPTAPTPSARDQAISPRYFTEIQMMQQAYATTANMRPDLAKRITDGVFQHIQQLNTLENQAEDRASKTLANAQRDNESLLFGATVLGHPIAETDLGNYLRTQQITPAGYNAIKAVQQKQAEGQDEPLVVARVWDGIGNGKVTSDDVFNGITAGQIKGTTGNEMLKAINARAKTTTNELERGDYNTLKTALNGHAIESGGINLFHEDERNAAQLWAQAQQEWNRRYNQMHENPDQILADMLPRYVKAQPTAPAALPNPRFGAVTTSKDVAEVAAKTRAAYEAGQITQDTYNSEGRVLDGYLTFFTRTEKAAAAAAAAQAGQRGNRQPTAQGSAR